MAKTIVVGGGPAGMLAAAARPKRARGYPCRAERKTGQETLYNGQGRCNLTNIAGAEEAFRNIPRNPKFLYSALASFGSGELIALVESWACP